MQTLRSGSYFSCSRHKTLRPAAEKGVSSNVLRPGQTSVFDPMRLIGIDTQSTFLIFFVFAVIAIEILDMRVTLESKNMGSDSIKKPSIMAYYDGAAGKVFKCLFES